jgi:hypothetical protein
MNHSISGRDVQLAMRAEVDRFAKELRAEREKVGLLFEKTEALEAHMVILVDRNDKLQASVSKCIPIIDNLEKSMSAMKSRTETENSQSEYLRFIEQRVKEKVLELRSELVSDDNEKGAKDNIVKNRMQSFGDDLKNLDKKINKMLSKFETTMHENDADIRKTIQERFARSDSHKMTLEKISAMINEGVSSKFGAIIEILNQKFVTQLSFESTKTELASRIASLTQSVVKMKSMLTTANCLTFEEDRLASFNHKHLPDYPFKNDGPKDPHNTKKPVF